MPAQPGDVTVVRIAAEVTCEKDDEHEDAPRIDIRHRVTEIGVGWDC